MGCESHTVTHRSASFSRCIGLLGSSCGPTETNAKKIALGVSGTGAHTFNPKRATGKRQGVICELKASLDYIVISRIARAT